MKKCWILSTPRTGGNFLSIILNECLGYHAFDEWLRDGVWTHKYTASEALPDYLNLHLDECRIKYQRADYDFLVALVPPETEFFVLKRRDLLAQAASFCISKASETWRIYGDKELSKYQSKQIHVEDEDIIESYKWVYRYADAWRDFTDKGCSTFFYEDLDLDPLPIVKKIADSIGVACDLERSIEAARKKFKKTFRPETEEVKRRLKEILSKNKLFL